MKYWISVCSCLLIVICCLSCAQEIPRPHVGIDMNWQPVDSLNQLLPPGVRLFSGEDTTLPLRAWYVAIDESSPAIKTHVECSSDSIDRRESATQFARRLGAVVVVNGGYFTMNRQPAEHVGLLIAHGKQIAAATAAVTRTDTTYPATRAALGFLGEDEVDIAWVSSEGDETRMNEAPFGNQRGRPAAIDARKILPAWPVRDAIAAGPALVSGGKIAVSADEEVFFGTSIPKVHPRTAAGYRTDGTLLLLVVDGRQEKSRGVNLQELAALMVDLDAVEALNLDGGGSSTMVVQGVLVNRPTGSTFQREVMSALATYHLGGGSD